ncbi:MAG: tetratricopeptide repeat protein, partial [Elusimicrobiaceae bacterium]|nr:tetratricopeptide repeat protein [Elusimicrobiaceae bacterium]
AFNSGKTEKALDYCDTAIELDPSKAEYYLQRGEILYDEDAGNFEEALEDFNKAIELDPSKAEYYLSRGHMLALEQTEKALADFNKAIELEPNNASYYDARSEFKWEYLQDRQGALDDINKAIELEPNYGPYYADRGWMKWINLKDYKGALKDYDKAVELTRKEDDYYIKLREDFKAEVIEAKAGDNVSAQQIVGESKVPANITPEVVARQKAKKHFKKYRKAYREHNIEEAYNNINEAIKYDPENAAYYHERAMLEYYNFENYMAGMEDMKMAHKLDPKNSRYGYILEERWGKELAAKETTKVPAKTEAEQTEVQQIAKQVKSDILNKYNDNTLMMSFFPTGFLGKIGKRVKAFLTNKPYLSEAKIKIVRNIVDDVAKEFEGKNIPEAELKAKINEQVAQRIKLDTRFTEAEKIEVLKEYQTRPVKIEKGKAGEYYEMALKNKKLGYKQQAYDYFEKAINTETRKSVKAQYSIEQARFLRYAKGTGREKINLRNTKGRAISYNEAALKSYDRAVEYATGKVKAKYLLERADFKRYNADFEGAKTDTELAKKLDPTIAK